MSSTEEVLTRECRQRLSDKAQAVAKKYGCYWVGYFNFNCFSKINIPSSKIYSVHETISWIGKDSYQTNDTVVTGATTTTTGKSEHHALYGMPVIQGESKESSNTQYQTKNVTNTHYVSVTKTKTIYLYYVLVNDKKSFDKLVYYRDHYEITEDKLQEATDRPVQKLDFVPYFKKWMKETKEERKTLKEKEKKKSKFHIFGDVCFCLTRFFACFYQPTFAVLTLIFAVATFLCYKIAARKELDNELLYQSVFLTVPVLYALFGNREAYFTDNNFYNLGHAGLLLVNALLLIYIVITMVFIPFFAPVADFVSDRRRHNHDAWRNELYREEGLAIKKDIEEIKRHLC